jgi:hypothetical protein
MQDLIKQLQTKRMELAAIKGEVDALEAQLHLALGEAIQDAYKAKGDPFGTVNLDADGIVFKVLTPKKVTWDQAALGELEKQIAAAGDTPEDYIKVSYEVSETKYNAWPEEIRLAFEPARTVAPGKVKIEFAMEDKNAH